MGLSWMQRREEAWHAAPLSAGHPAWQHLHVRMHAHGVLVAVACMQGTPELAASCETFASNSSSVIDQHNQNKLLASESPQLAC